MNWPTPLLNTVSLLLVVALLISLMWLIARVSHRTNKLQLSQLEHRYQMLRAKMNNAKRGSDRLNYSELRDLFVQVDVWMGHMLTLYGIKDETIGGKLKSEKLKQSISKDFLNDLWQIHKVRNQIVHEDHVPTTTEIAKCEETIDQLHKFIH